MNSGVAIGNERVSTVHRVAEARPALTGMDLVRLGLERARSADEAVGIMTDLLTTHGQGGIADAVRQEAYDSSFLIADAGQAFVLDTSGTSFAAAPFPDGTAISNRITLGSNWTKGSTDLLPGEDFERFRDHSKRTGYADVRLAASRSFLAGHPRGRLTPAAMAAHLRDHGQGPWGEPGVAGPASPPPTEVRADFTGISVCMHVSGLSVTAASLIAVLPADLSAGAPVQAYVALGSPCVSIFVPAFPSTVAGLPSFVPRELWREEMWRTADALACRLRPTPASISAVRQCLAPVEADLWAEADAVGSDRTGGPRSAAPGASERWTPWPPASPDAYPLNWPDPALHSPNRDDRYPPRQGETYAELIDGRRDRSGRCRHGQDAETVGLVPRRGHPFCDLRFCGHQLQARQCRMRS